MPEDPSHEDPPRRKRRGVRCAQRFIPFRKADVVALCVAEGRLDEETTGHFRQFCRILESIFHFEFHAKLETLKNCYAPFNPDVEYCCSEPRGPEECAELSRRLVDCLREVLERGNFEPIPMDEIERALVEESLFRIRLHVDFDDFEEILFFRRGKTVRRETIREYAGVRKRTIDVPTYGQVVVYVKFKGEEHFRDKKRKSLLYRPGVTLIKLFRNIPVSDMEMLFPNSSVRMKPIDKVFMGVPALAGGVFVLVSKMGAALGFLTALVMFWLGFSRKEPAFNAARLVALGGAFSALGFYLFQQWSKYKNRKISFMKALTENLYFKNLDNNAGVFHRLIDAAEEEECKEAILAYFFLLTSRCEFTEAELDAAVEEWFQTKHDCPLDFEVGDALQKLERLGLAWQRGNVWCVVPLEQAKRRLDELWDNYFTWNGPS